MPSTSALENIIHHFGGIFPEFLQQIPKKIKAGRSKPNKEKITNHFAKEDIIDVNI